MRSVTVWRRPLPRTEQGPEARSPALHGVPVPSRVREVPSSGPARPFACLRKPQGKGHSPVSDQPAPSPHKPSMSLPCPPGHGHPASSDFKWRIQPWAPKYGASIYGGRTTHSRSLCLEKRGGAVAQALREAFPPRVCSEQDPGLCGCASLGKSAYPPLKEVCRNRSPPVLKAPGTQGAAPAVQGRWRTSACPTVEKVRERGQEGKQEGWGGGGGWRRGPPC